MAIPSGSTDFKTKGSLGEIENIEMTIDEKGFKFLMSILTNLYEYPTLAVIREYCTNAVDAHIDAGYDGPVEVTMPTFNSRNFIVRDYGPGMDIDDIRNTYSKYVASTKRQDNTQAGMFGIGAKSALALGDQFTVESVKNGYKIVVVVQRKGRGEASMKVVVNNQQTTDPNGTTIKVPADNPNRFAEQAKKFFPYIKRGKFLVDGEDMGETFEGVKVNDDLYALPYSLYNNTSYVVMGNVPYPVETTERRRVVKYVPSGTFEPTPPREALEQGSGFMQTIKGYFEEAAEGLAKTVTEDIKDMAPEEAAGHLIKHTDTLSKWSALGKVEYKGRRMDDDYKYTGCVRVMGSSSYEPSGTVQFWKYFLGGHIVGLDDKTVKDISKYHCAKATNARSLIEYPNSTFIHYGGNKPTLASSSLTLTWDRIVQYSKSVNSHRYGSNVHAAGDDWKVPTRQVSFVRDNTPKFPKRRTEVVPYGDWKGPNDSRDLVYFSPTELETRAAVQLYNSLVNDDDVFLVIKYANQHAKTKRENPEAIHLSEYGKIKAARLITKYGQEPFLSVSLPSKWVNLKGDMFDDLRDLRSKARSEPDINGNDRSLVREFHKDSLTIEQDFDTLVEAVRERYPLLDNIGWGTNTDHLNEYVRAIDAYKEKEA